MGFDYSMQNEDTIWQQKVKLVNTNNSWSYDVTGKGEKDPIKFKLTEIENAKFTCENQVNEFPKIIAYSIMGDTLHAKISGNEMEVNFHLRKRNLINGKVFLISFSRQTILAEFF